MGKVYTSLFLILWYIIGLSTMADDNWPTRIIVFVASFPVLFFVLYLIWFDSRLPKEQQFRYYNSRFGKNERQRP